MRLDMLCQLPIMGGDLEYESSWTFDTSPIGILSLAWWGKESQINEKNPVISLLGIEVDTGRITYQTAYQIPGIYMEGLILGSNTRDHTLFVAWTDSPSAQARRRIVCCPMSMKASLPPTPIVIDDAVADNTYVGPILLLAATGDRYRILYMKPSIDDTEPSGISIGQVAINGVRTDIDVQSIEMAVEAGAVAQKNWWSLLMLDAEADEPIWRLIVAGFKTSSSIIDWKHILNISLPATADPYADFWLDITVEASFIAGPVLLAEGKTTVVVGVTLIKNPEVTPKQSIAKIQSAQNLICLREDGQIVQECQSAVGRFLQMGVVGTMVVGIDMIQASWRLWNWFPLEGSNQFGEIRWLGTDAIRIHVVTEQAEIGQVVSHMWTVEELAHGIRISKYEARSLTKIDASYTLPDARLVSRQRDTIWQLGEQNPKVIVAYNNSLFLLGADKQDQVALYQIR